jgi:hypothetical protein
MQKIEDFRKHAQACRAMAKRAHSSGDRVRLLSMAKTWDGLAAARVAQIGQRERVWGVAADLFPSVV